MNKNYEEIAMKIAKEIENVLQQDNIRYQKDANIYKININHKYIISLNEFFPYSGNDLLKNECKLSIKIDDIWHSFECEEITHAINIIRCVESTGFNFVIPYLEKVTKICCLTYKLKSDIQNIMGNPFIFMQGKRKRLKKIIEENPLSEIKF